jgi:hypothetical protein
MTLAINLCDLGTIKMSVEATLELNGGSGENIIVMGDMQKEKQTNCCHGIDG